MALNMRHARDETSPPPVILCTQLEICGRILCHSASFYGDFVVYSYQVGEHGSGSGW